MQIVSYSYGCDELMLFSALYMRWDFQKYSFVQERMSVVLAMRSEGRGQGVLKIGRAHV